MHQVFTTRSSIKIHFKTQTCLMDYLCHCSTWMNEWMNKMALLINFIIKGNRERGLGQSEYFQRWWWYLYSDGNNPKRKTKIDDAGKRLNEGEKSWIG